MRNSTAAEGQSCIDCWDRIAAHNRNFHFNWLNRVIGSIKSTQSHDRESTHRIQRRSPIQLRCGTDTVASGRSQHRLVHKRSNICSRLRSSHAEGSSSNAFNSVLNQICSCLNILNRNFARNVIKRNQIAIRLIFVCIVQERTCTKNRNIVNRCNIHCHRQSHGTISQPVMHYNTESSEGSVLIQWGLPSPIFSRQEQIARSNSISIAE